MMFLCPAFRFGLFGDCGVRRVLTGSRANVDLNPVTVIHHPCEVGQFI